MNISKEANSMRTKPANLQHVKGRYFVRKEPGMYKVCHGNICVEEFISDGADEYEQNDDGVWVKCEHSDEVKL